MSSLGPSERQPSPGFSDSPLSQAEVQKLETCLLPALERHHLRLMAHALRTLQCIAAGLDDCAPEALPDANAIRAWLLKQPGLAEEPDFVETLAQQLEASAEQLARQAAELGRSTALGLELDDLMAWAAHSADQRLLNQPPSAAPPGEPAGPQQSP